MTRVNLQPGATFPDLELLDSAGNLRTLGDQLALLSSATPIARATTALQPRNTNADAASVAESSAPVTAVSGTIPATCSGSWATALAASSYPYFLVPAVRPYVRLHPRLHFRGCGTSPALHVELTGSSCRLTQAQPAVAQAMTKRKLRSSKTASPSACQLTKGR